MFSSKNVLVITAALLFAMPQAASANINDRQSSQQARITQGIVSGELTARESVKLVRGQAQLQRMKMNARADGVVTRKEKANLNAKANRESDKIFRNKHDRQTRN